MPTASQCQILGTIVKRNTGVAYVAADASEDAEDVREPPPRRGDAPTRAHSACAVPPYVRVAPEFAVDLEIQTRQENSKETNRRPGGTPTAAWVKESQASVSLDKALDFGIGTRLRGALGRTLDSDAVGWGKRTHQPEKKTVTHEITDFQQERMDIVVQTLMPRPNNTKEFVPKQTRKQDSIDSAELEKVINDVQAENVGADDLKTSDCSDNDMQPLIRFNSRVKVYDMIQNKLFETEKPFVQGSGGEGGCQGYEVIAPDLVFPMFSPESLRTKLYELGWRRPIKGKKKQKGKTEEKVGYHKQSYDLSNLSHYMDPKKDPVLRRAKKGRAAPAQTKPPEPNPNAVCFNILGSTLTHREVWIALKRDVLAQHPEVRIKSIQFIPRAIFIKRPKGGDPIEDRWVITFTSEWFRNRVAGMDLDIGGGPVQLRRYDDIVNCEYRQFTRMNDYMKMVNAKK